MLSADQGCTQAVSEPGYPVTGTRFRSEPADRGGIPQNSGYLAVGYPGTRPCTRVWFSVGGTAVWCVWQPAPTLRLPIFQRMENGPTPSGIRNQFSWWHSGQCAESNDGTGMSIIPSQTIACILSSHRTLAASLLTPSPGAGDDRIR